MDRLPPELLDPIAQHTRFTSHATLTSLARVSRKMLEVARRHCTWNIVGFKDGLAFLDLLYDDDELKNETALKPSSIRRLILRFKPTSEMGTNELKITVRVFCCLLDLCTNVRNLRVTDFEGSESQLQLLGAAEALSNLKSAELGTYAFDTFTPLPQNFMQLKFLAVVLDTSNSKRALNLPKCNITQLQITMNNFNNSEFTLLASSVFSYLCNSVDLIVRDDRASLSADIVAQGISLIPPSSITNLFLE